MYIYSIPSTIVFHTAYLSPVISMYFVKVWMHRLYRGTIYGVSIIVIYKDAYTFLENPQYWVDSSLGKKVWHEVVTLKWSWAEMAMGRNDPEPVPLSGTVLVF